MATKRVLVYARASHDEIALWRDGEAVSLPFGEAEPGETPRTAAVRIAAAAGWELRPRDEFEQDDVVVVAGDAFLRAPLNWVPGRAGPWKTLLCFLQDIPEEQGRLVAAYRNHREREEKKLSQRWRQHEERVAAGRAAARERWEREARERPQQALAHAMRRSSSSRRQYPAPLKGALARILKHHDVVVEGRRGGESEHGCFCRYSHASEWNLRDIIERIWTQGRPREGVSVRFESKQKEA